MRVCGWWWWWAAMLLVTRVAAAPSIEDKTDSSLQEESIKEVDSNGNSEGEEKVLHRVVRQLFDGFRFESSLKDGILALENVDDMLRTTIPNVDKFQCLQRVMCSVMSTDTSALGSSISSSLQQAFDPTFQQGIIQDPQLVQQEIQQNPAFQGLLSQNPSLQDGLSSLTSVIQQGLSSQNPAFQQGFPPQNPGFQQGFPSQNPTFQQGFPPQNPTFQQGIPPQNPAFQQGFPPQNPAFQQGFPPQNPAFQQGFPPQNPAFQQGFPPQNPAFQPDPSFQNPAFIQPPPPGFAPQFQAPPGQVVQGGFQTFQPFSEGTSFQNSFPNFRENPDTQNVVRRTNNPRPQRRRKPSRRPQRNSFFDFLGRLGLGRRKKRSLLDDVFSGLSGDTFMGLLDQMMRRYSFYPYTHAAYMGYSGTPRECETLYPSCPSTPEAMIDVFNNLHKHFPDGIPYKESLPWPLNVLLP